MTARAELRSALVAATLALIVATVASAQVRLRVATFNTSLWSNEAGGVVRRLEAGDAAAREVAAVLQRVRPDLVLLNEIDYDPEGRAAELFERDYLAVPQGGGEPLRYPHRYLAAVNTGEPSGLDLDRDGRSDGPGDAWGFGRHPGQYGMLVLSMHPIDPTAVRSFRMLRWSAMPGALRPVLPDGTPFYDDVTWSRLRLSSKSHWDVPVLLPGDRTLHFLVSHPTPPVFDGPEDRNGRRNHDELRLWLDYLDPGGGGYLVDDAGATGGLEAGARFVVAGDLNADPHDGDGLESRGVLRALLSHPRVDAALVPESRGAVAASPPGSPAHAGDPAQDTCVAGRVGNLRLDYVLASRGLEVVGGAVFWPAPDEPDAELADASDHHLVWLDLIVP